MQQILKGLPRKSFDRLVAKHQADKHSKGFGCWDQLVAMIYGHLSGAGSLRQLEAGFNSQSSHHDNLGTGPVRRSTLAEANSRRSAVVFEQAAHLLMGLACRQLRQEGQALLYLLDSTSITLKGRGFDTWTRDNRTRNTQGIKLHLLYAAHQHIPLLHSFTAANVNDIQEGVKLPIEQNATYVFDKGYCDYNWWAKIDAAGAFFVTRQKKNAAYTVVETRPASAEHILSDEVILFPRNRKRSPAYSQPLRRIVVERPGKQPLVLISNQLQTTAEEIAEQYRQRWQIELLFKWFKQHLKLKTFLGRSENAVRLQILAALIAFLLFKRYRDSSPELAAETLWIGLASVSSNLFLRPLTEYARHKRRQADCSAAQLRQAGLF